MNPVIIGRATLYNADCIEVMAGLPDNSLDSIICDPPYLISFMSKGFDTQHKSLPGANEGQKMQEWHRRWVTEAYRILKPGGHLAAFGGDRTHHRLMSAMEDVGFELRFNCYWAFGSGFPKSQSASMAIDQHFGVKDQREFVEKRNHPTLKDKSKVNRDGASGFHGANKIADEWNITEPAHPLAKQWSGYGTALKPAVEPICVGRKPMIGTLAENLLTWGCGAMNLDACRVETNDSLNGGAYSNGTKDLSNASSYATGINIVEFKQPIGRFPPHLLHDGSDVVKQCFPETGSAKESRSGVRGGSSIFDSKTIGTPDKIGVWPADSGGSASRFFPSLPYDEEDCATLFYCAKASRTDRNEGCEMMEEKNPWDRNCVSKALEGLGSLSGPRQNNHVSVKPTNLMRWICRLLTPKGGTLLDPFMGSGSTLKAAVLENFKCIGIEMDEDYFAIAEARVAHISQEIIEVKRERVIPAQAQSSLF
jgi:DNA modification methylase